jgi:Protein of unknown function (DUF3551)
MRALRIMLLGGLFMPSMLHAQSASIGTGAAAQGQFCATYNDDATPMDCSFTTLQMCQQSVSGVGGYCAPQALAPAMPPPPLFRPFQDPSAFAPATVPPPPFVPPPIDPAAAPLPQNDY